MNDPNRKRWNEQMQELQRGLARSADHQKIIDLFLKQHAMVHAREMSQTGLWSLDDELWEGLSEDSARSIPPKSEHSIIWMMWHIARCEDITMNLLVAGSPQVLHSGSWLEMMKITTRDTGNAMSPEEIAAFSAVVDVRAVRAYRTAVGRQTREIAQQLPPGALKQKMDPARVQQITEQGAVDEQAQWLIDYWKGRTVAGLLTMPATRHNFVHLNEAIRLKQILSKKEGTL
jgi:hypothetical protein